ncbi:MAG: hypothetical protein WCF08_07870 [Anaerolineaceae bacterium]
MHKGVVVLNSVLRSTYGSPSGFWWMASQFDPTQTIYTILYKRDDGGEFIGQVRVLSQAKISYLTLLGGNEEINPNDLAFIIKDLTIRVQRMGSIHLVAEVDHKHPLLEKMKASGFGVSAWQDIWQFTHQPDFRQETDLPGEWCPLAEVDWWQAYQLLQAVTPPISQMTDLPTRYLSRFWVCHKDTRIIAFADIRYGPQGIWIQPAFDPEVSHCPDLLCDLIHCLPARLSRPVYLSVRSYQSWLFRSIELLGAEYVAHQAILVKHLAGYIKEFSTSELLRLEKRKVKPSNPVLPSRSMEK